MSEFKPGVIQPGMSQIIEAGDTLEITDENGRKFAVEAVEGPQTLDFCKAFDTWLTMKKSGIEGPVITAAFANLVNSFDHLPLRIQRELPSMNLGFSL